jgi:hypothetical protein
LLLLSIRLVVRSKVSQEFVYLYIKAPMSQNDQPGTFQPEFHDHLMLTIVQRDNTFPEGFSISKTTAQELSPNAIARIQDVARGMLGKNMEKLLTECRPVCRLDATHSFILQLEYETRLQIDGPVMFCFSFRICPYSATCREGLYIPEPGKQKHAWEF